MTTTLPLTLSLAVAFGIYMIAGAIGTYRLGDCVGALIDEFESSPALTFVTGVFTFALGVALILVHNIWTDILSGFISLFGWVAAAEGLLLIAWPSVLWDFARGMTKAGTAKVFAALVLGLGILLIILGVTGRAG